MPYIIDIIHIILIVIKHVLICYLRADGNPVGLLSERAHSILEVKQWSSHRESILRFIPEGYEVPSVLIHLVSRILQRHGSWLCILSIAMMVMSARVCPSPLKCSATGD